MRQHRRHQMAFNRPQLTDRNGENKIKRYVHSPLETEHNGITTKIKTNGRVVFSKPAGLDKDGKTPLYDEIEIPASLVFRTANLLHATRKTKWVSVSELSDTVEPDEAEEADSVVQG